MSEWRRTDEHGRPVYDDDRLLALVLGLDDDPGLEAAAARDDELGRRLERMRAEVAAVGGRLDAVVPASDDRYADPTDARWSGLGEYFAAPPARPERRGAARWLRVLAPVAVVAVAAAVGVGVLASQSGDRLATNESGSAAIGFDAQQPKDLAGESADGVSGVTGAEPEGPETKRGALLAKQVDAHAVVVVARATESAGGVQRFTVVRVLKGEAPAEVRLGVVTRPAEGGALYVLFLDPAPSGDASSSAAPATAPPPSAEATPVPSPAPTTAQPPGSSGSPSPDASPGETRQMMPALRRALAFRLDGDRVLVRRLPAGVDIDALLLP